MTSRRRQRRARRRTGLPPPSRRRVLALRHWTNSCRCRALRGSRFLLIRWEHTRSNALEITVHVGFVGQEALAPIGRPTGPATRGASVH